MKRTEPGLKGARLAKHKTQDALAADAGVLQVTISKIEKNGPSRGVLIAIKLARALGTSVEDIFEGYLDKSVAKARTRTAVHNHRRERAATGSTG